MIRFLAFASLVVMATPALGFDIDMSKRDMRMAVKQLTVSDLATGEVGLTATPVLCTADDKLHVFDNVGLLEAPMQYGMNFRVRREPGNSISIEVQPGASATDKDWRTAIVRTIAQTSECKGYLEVFGAGLMAVTSINGAASASQLIAGK